METKQVIVVRKDLNMRKGKIGAQVAHASMGVILEECKHVNDNSVLLLASFKKDDPMFHWLTGKFVKIVVGCNSEEELIELSKKAKEENIRHCLVQDVGKTEFHGIPTWTTLAVGPDLPEKIDEITGHLPLI